jgi:hypothetical protein
MINFASFYWRKEKHIPRVDEAAPDFDDNESPYLGESMLAVFYDCNTVACLKGVCTCSLDMEHGENL